LNGTKGVTGEAGNNGIPVTEEYLIALAKSVS